MAHFSGKWRLTHTENAEAFFDAVHGGDEFKAKLRLVAAEFKSNPDVYIEELHVDKAAHTIHREIYIKGEKMRDSGVVKFGSEIEKKCYGSEKLVKVRVELESDTKIVRHEKGEGFVAVKTIELHGDELHVTFHTGSITATQKFHRV